MINITDLCLILCSLLFIVNGASRGFLRSLVGPVAFIIGTVLGIVCYQFTKDFLFSLLVTIISPMFIGWIIGLCLNLWYPTDDWKPNPISQILGAIITWIWGIIFVYTVIVFFAIVPPVNAWLKVAQDDVLRSYCYRAVKPLVDSTLPFNKPSVPSKHGAANQPQVNDMQALAQDPRFKEVMQDPQIQKYIEQKNYAGLMSNPKIMKLTQEIMQDPEMFKRLMRVSQQKSQAAGSNPKQ